MSYEQKYLKYKQKYLELKKQLEMNGGGDTVTNDISVNTENVLNLSETPVGQTGGFFGLFKSNDEPKSEPIPEPDQVPETELNLTETPVVANDKVSNDPVAEPVGEPQAEHEVNTQANQKIYTEVNLGPESNIKNMVLSETPTNEQSGGFLGLFSSKPGPAPSSNNVPCPGTVNVVPDGAVGSDTMENAAAAAEAERAAAEAERAAAAEAERAAAAEAERAAAERAAAETAERAAAEAAAEAAERAAAEAAERAAAEAAAVEQPAPVPEGDVTPAASSKYSVGNSEVNNTEDIERLFSQLGGNYTDLVDDSSSSIFSTESDLSLTLSDDDLLENL